ncbi:MAG: PQQ-binding-like beta-propeller repeat protein [Acidobacteriota bacterium]
MTRVTLLLLLYVGAMCAQPAADWPLTGRDYAETHYSPLNQVNASNVANLKSTWTFDMSAAGSPAGQLEASPIISNGVMYITGVWSTVFALDARTGELKWKYDPQLPRTGGPRLCCGAVNRGVALSNGKVFVGLLDARLVALDASTGKVVWDVQTSVDLKESYSITGAPARGQGQGDYRQRWRGECRARLRHGLRHGDRQARMAILHGARRSVETL